MSLVAMRKRLILELVGRDGAIRIGSLAKRLQVSTETIRRDLKALEKAGELTRVRGGALPTKTHEISSFSDRSQQFPLEKVKIGTAAASLVQAGESVFLGIGATTSLCAAEALARAASCHVTTAALDVAQVLGASGRHEVVLTGGQYDPRHNALRGAGVLEALENRFFDISLFSAHAISAEYGVVDLGDFQFHVQRLLRKRSRRYVILADSSKFGRSGYYKSLPLHAVDVIVTDQEPASPFDKSIGANGVELVLGEEELTNSI